MKSKKTTAYLSQTAMIAACYVALTLLFAPISFGAIQVRISESLTILPLLFDAAIPGLFIGCLVANILGGAILADIIFGSLATLIAAILSYKISRCSRISNYLGSLPPIIVNMIVVPLILRYGYGLDGGTHYALLFFMVTTGCGELISCGVIGTLLYVLLQRHSHHFSANI